MKIETPIGPTFPGEVQASACLGWPFSWHDNGVDWADGDLDEGQVAELTALVEAHDPAAEIPPGPRLATGKQLGEALVALGVIGDWDTDFNKNAKHEDKMYWGASYRNRIPEDNPKIARLCDRVINIKMLYDQALGEPVKATRASKEPAKRTAKKPARRLIK
jgi:hypothetical protein